MKLSLQKVLTAKSGVERIHIHHRAIQTAANYRKAESELLKIIQEIDAHKVYLDLERTSLFDYAVKDLKLDEHVA